MRWPALFSAIFRRGANNSIGPKSGIRFSDCSDPHSKRWSLLCASNGTHGARTCLVRPVRNKHRPVVDRLGLVLPSTLLDGFAGGDPGSSPIWPAGLMAASGQTSVRLRHAWPMTHADVTSTQALRSAGRSLRLRRADHHARTPQNEVSEVHTPILFQGRDELQSRFRPAGHVTAFTCSSSASGSNGFRRKA